MDVTTRIQAAVARVDMWLAHAAHELGDALPWLAVAALAALTIALNLRWNKLK